MLGGINGEYNVEYGKSMSALMNANTSAANKSGDSILPGSKNVVGIEECQTCKTRRYQDGSNDPGVSMKSPTNLSPGQAASAVFSHEREHYTREQAKAESEDREVIENSIRIFTAVCPECGKVYVSGGETRTMTRNKNEQASFAKKFFDENVGIYLPKEFDARV